jgi:hypothetical protein
MNLRKTAVVILGLLILLSGCSSDTAADTASQKEEGANIHAGENHGRETIDDLAADENPAEDDVTENVRDDSNESPIEDDTSAGDIEGAGEDAGSGIIELIPMKQLPDLTMDPQTPFTIDDIINWGTCVLTPG